MKIWVSFYELSLLNHPNSRENRSSRSGVLLKILFPEGFGYADYHPWKELRLRGDLFEKLQYIRNSRLSVDFQHSVAQAQIDARFRRKSQSGFACFPHIKITNHYLILDVRNFSLQKLLKLEAQGYHRFKVKMGRYLEAESLGLRNLCQNCSGKFRLDFNESLDEKGFHIWLDKNSDLLKHIEFIEDPMPFKASQWINLSRDVDLALDMAAPALEVDTKAFRVLVLKPSFQNIPQVVERYTPLAHTLVVTHSMDHPLGQSIAGWWAYWIKDKLKDRVIECGLQSRDLFEDKGPLSEFLRPIHSPQFIPPKGLGWGFDKPLDRVHWMEL